jgi:hypothetical protein
VAGRPLGGGGEAAATGGRRREGGGTAGTAAAGGGATGATEGAGGGGAWVALGGSTHVFAAPSAWACERCLSHSAADTRAIATVALRLSALSSGR